MPVVPITSRRSAKAPLRAPPPEPWALMAAAQMHAEGRLVEPGSSPVDTLPPQLKAAPK